MTGSVQKKMLREALEPRLIRVENLGDPRVMDYRDLREKDLAVRRRAFIAESEVVLRVMVSRCRYPMRSVFLADGRIDKLADALVAVPDEVPIYVAEQAVLDEVVGFHIHRGVLAAGERTPLPEPAELLSAPGRVVVLESLTNHDNVGGVFRNAAAFGASGVLIDGPTCDPLYRKAIRVSVGGSLTVPFARATASSTLIAAARAAGFHLVALSPRSDARPLAALSDVPDRVALLLGTEGAGLSEAAMGAAEELVRVEMEPGFDSLNVATTSGIALHAIRNAQLTT
jgi:tRNA G18 (ribose-2'-O)-methylase SpoU